LHVVDKCQDVLPHVGIPGDDLLLHFLFVKNVGYPKFYAVLHQNFVDFEHFDPEVHIQKKHGGKQCQNQRKKQCHHLLRFDEDNGAKVQGKVGLRWWGDKIKWEMIISGRDNSLRKKVTNPICWAGHLTFYS